MQREQAGYVNPRVRRTRERILAGARELIAARGVEALTIEAVAEQAKVSRTTIYRHWGRMSNLVIDAVDSASADLEPAPPQAGVRDDLVAVYRGLAARLSNPAKSSMLVAMLAAAEHDERLRRSYRRTVLAWRAQVRSLLTQAMDRGELPATTDVELAVDLLAAPPFYRRLVSGQPADAPGYVERVVDTVLAGLGLRTPHPDGADDHAAPGRSSAD
ncbi:MAG TPA: TetR/AcrR family transcriptional regulator [Actinomycetes bacterium]|nr:TetR/AcrR family transcriptional regulator [Actinomycetes bacterium]